MEWRSIWPTLTLVILIIICIGTGVLIGFITHDDTVPEINISQPTTASQTRTSASTSTTTKPPPPPTTSTQPTQSGSFLIAFQGSSEYSDNHDNTDKITSVVIISKPFWRVEYSCQPKIGSSLDFMIFAFAVFPGTSSHDSDDYVKVVGPLESPTSDTIVLDNAGDSYYFYVYSINCTWELKVYE